MSDVFPTFRKCCDGTFLRGRLIGPNWQSDLRESELPEEVSRLITLIVKKSRLWRSEKASVTRELIAHFQDGVQSGHSYSELNQEFGDPAVTAELIRRAKIRNRPMLMKLLRAMGLGVGVIVSAYVLLSAYFYLGKPTPNVDYVVQLNQSIADFDESDKAWPIYRPLWTKYGFSEGGGFRLDEINYRNPDDESDGRLIRPTDPGWQAAVEALAQYDDLLDGFRRGARLPSLGVELHADARNYSDEDFAAIMPGHERSSYKGDAGSYFQDAELDELMRGATIGVLLPHVQVLRKAARMFAVDTRIAVEQGDTERATEDLKTIFGLARQAAEGDFLICGLVGIAVTGIGFDQLEDVLTQNPEFFSSEQLADLQSHIEQISVREWIDLEGERAMLHDMIQRIYTDDGNGSGRITPAGVKLLANVDKVWGMRSNQMVSEFEDLLTATRAVAAPAALFLCASRKEMTAKGDELIDRASADYAKPFYDRSGPDIDPESFLEENRVKFYLLSTMFPATKQVRNAMDRTIGRQEGVIAALAIHRYYLKYGQWPQDYADVSPEFVSEFPIDQINGALLKFKTDDEGLLIYSVGNDRDDDGGKDRVFRGQIQSRARFIIGSPRDEPDGDWIVWPQRDNDW